MQTHPESVRQSKVDPSGNKRDSLSYNHRQKLCWDGSRELFRDELEGNYITWVHMGPQVAFPILKAPPAASILETPWRQPPVCRYSSTHPPPCLHPFFFFLVGMSEVTSVTKA